MTEVPVLAPVDAERRVEAAEMVEQVSVQAHGSAETSWYAWSSGRVSAAVRAYPSSSHSGSGITRGCGRPPASHAATAGGSPAVEIGVEPVPDDQRPRGRHRVGDQAQVVRRRDAVLVEEGDDAARARRRAEVPGPGRPKALVRLAHDPGRVRPATDDGGACRAVVGDDELERSRRHGLVVQSGEQPVELVLPLEVGDDDADLGPGHANTVAVEAIRGVFWASSSRTSACRRAASLVDGPSPTQSPAMSVRDGRGRR